MPAAAKQDWQTPEWIVEKVHKIFPGGFYDPCSEWSNPTRAMGWSTPEGLHGVAFGTALPRFWNPPFGNLTRWIQDACFISRTAPAVLLVPLRTHTKWYQDMMGSGAVLSYCHLAERVKFRGAKAGYREPIALFFLSNTWDGNTYGVETMSALYRFDNEFSAHGFLHRLEVW